jgi:hypothetical protein
MSLEMIPFEQMLPAAQNWQLLKQQARELINSNFLPSGIKTPEQAVAIILKGRELGVPPMQALSHIHVINGKPTMSAELMLAQVLKLHPKTKISYPERSSDKCVMKVQRYGSEPSIFSFTIGDAEAAGLLNNSTWKKYPRAMLHARCVSEMCRSLFPDAIAGVSYTSEEMGANVNENGEVIDVPSTETKLDNPPAKVTVVETPPASTPNAAAAATFDKSNRQHLKFLLAFLEKKGNPGLMDDLIKRMEGKPALSEVVETEYALINPDSPDKEPEA